MPRAWNKGCATGQAQDRIHGQKLFDNFTDYGVSVSNGDFDTDDQKDVVARVAYRPFGSCESMLQYFQIGISASTGFEIEPIQPATAIR